MVKKNFRAIGLMFFMSLSVASCGTGPKETVKGEKGDKGEKGERGEPGQIVYQTPEPRPTYTPDPYPLPTPRPTNYPLPYPVPVPYPVPYPTPAPTNCGQPNDGCVVICACIDGYWKTITVNVHQTQNYKIRNYGTCENPNQQANDCFKFPQPIPTRQC